MRVRRGDPVRDAASPPPELAERCLVEDWCSPAELAAIAARPPDPNWQRPDRHWREAALLLAYGRHREARRAWLTLHGVPSGAACAVIPYRRPSWRNPPP